MNSNIVLTKNQAATQLSVSIQTLDKMFKRGELPRIQVTTRRVGVLQSDINKHLESRRVVGC
jgi:predicted site-specific integrase-resolvase